MSLISLPSDILKLILAWLDLKSLSLSTSVCGRFNKLAFDVLQERALRGRTVSPHLVKAHQLLQPKLKRWQFYLLLRFSFAEVEASSIKFINPRFLLAIAFYQNQLELIEKWLPLAFNRSSESNHIETDFFYFLEICTLYSYSQAFLVLLKFWPQLPRKLRSFPNPLPVRFLSLFTEDERKFIVTKLKFLSPMALFLTKKFISGNLQLEKLSPEQQQIAYDCYPEDKLHLLNQNRRLKFWAYYRIQCQKGQILRTCRHHFRWDHPLENIYQAYNLILKEHQFKELDYDPHSSPEWCLEYDIKDCQIERIDHTNELTALVIELMNFQNRDKMDEKFLRDLLNRSDDGIELTVTETKLVNRLVEIINEQEKILGVGEAADQAGIKLLAQELNSSVKD